ncbi:DNA/RNA non-specific endonuclease [Actinomadura geliboluensis]|uniref:DNA/RNA non-specific endonuclease n=1 Tax=Actinomadura geliboluensis TaxID=882440 RepID=UPI0036824ECA
MERRVETPTATNDIDPLLDGLGRTRPNQNARPQTRPRPPSPSEVRHDTDANDDECVHVKDYGYFNPNGQHTGAYARFCEKANLEGGSKALNSIYPPAWPADLEDGRSGNPKIGSSYKYSHCHLIADKLGGSGKNPDNLITCLQKPVNSPVMRGREKEVGDAVRDGQIVDYWVTPIYNRGSAMPNKIHIVARGRYKDGAPGINLDRCIINRVRSAATDKWKVDYPGGFC